MPLQLIARNTEFVLVIETFPDPICSLCTKPIYPPISLQSTRRVYHTLKFKHLVSANSSGRAPCSAILCMGLHVHGGLGLPAFNSPLLKTHTNQISSLGEGELVCPWNWCRVCELYGEKLPGIFKTGCVCPVLGVRAVGVGTAPD